MVEDLGPTSLRASISAHLVLELGVLKLSELYRYSCSHISIIALTVYALCKQLRVQMVSSSALPEAVSMVIDGVTVWLTALTPLMKQTVVSWGFLKPQLCRRKTTNLRRHVSVFLKVNGSSRLRFQVGSTLLTACADTWNSRLSVLTCQYLGYRYLTCHRFSISLQSEWGFSGFCL